MINFSLILKDNTEHYRTLFTLNYHLLLYVVAFGKRNKRFTFIASSLLTSLPKLLVFHVFHRLSSIMYHFRHYVLGKISQRERIQEHNWVPNAFRLRGIRLLQLP